MKAKVTQNYTVTISRLEGELDRTVELADRLRDFPEIAEQLREDAAGLRQRITALQSFVADAVIVSINEQVEEEGE